jgi:DNA polymerase-3 subunit delta'
MSDLSFILTHDLPSFIIESQAWSDMLGTFASGVVPHAWAVRAPLAVHEPLLNVMSRLCLCESGRGDDNCGGCRGWSREEGGVLRHPDLVVVGDFDKGGNIEACRALIKELSLKPVIAKRRLGVVLAADKLLVHAANSLLKIAEEPPSYAHLLFLMEGNDFLPTLRSRSRFTTFAAPLFFEAHPAPDGEAEWARWLEELKDDEDMTELLSSWGSYFLETGNLEAATRTERFRLLVLQKKLSQTMVHDLSILTLKEELPFEPIFSSFW